MSRIGNEFDLAIIGSGGLPCLLGLVLLDVCPKLNILIASDAGGSDRSLDLSVQHLMNDRIMSAIGDLVVREWTGFSVYENGQVSSFTQDICMIDLSHGWVELSAKIGSDSIVRPASNIRVSNNEIRWKGGHASARAILSLPKNISQILKYTLIDTILAAELSKPVFADFHISGGRGSFYQYIPIDHRSIAINKVSMDAFGGNSKTTGTLDRFLWNPAYNLLEKYIDECSIQSIS